MSASRFVGRIGGLAVALGVGAVAFGGTSVAWADSPSIGSSSAHDGSGSSADAGQAGRGAQRTNKHAGPKASKVFGGVPSAASKGKPVAAPDLGAISIAERESSASSAPAAASVAAAVPDDAVDPPASAAAVVVRQSINDVSQVATAGTPGGRANTDPLSPVGSMTELALLEFSRRQTNAAGLAPAAAIAPASAGFAAAARTANAQAEASQNVAWVMGPSGDPIPSADYIQAVYDLYIAANSPDGTVTQGLVTPEGLYPITGVKSLPLNISVDQGNTILEGAIQDSLDAGDTITVFGYSQSAIISSLVMSGLDPTTPINFVLVGNEMNPNGGFLSRFPGNFSMPSLGIPFYGATPADAFSVANYTLEYDGFADFPKYPGNFLSVLNAGLGLAFVHTTYSKLTEEQVAAAIELPTSTETQKYYIIPHPDLPLLEPIRMIPLIGDPIADLLQPALKVIVNLGYGDPNYGWTNTGFANEQQTFSVLPDVDWGEVVHLLVAGVQQGIHDFINDFSAGGSFWQDLGALTTPISHSNSSGSTGGPTSVQSLVDNVISTVQTTVQSVAEFVSNAASSVYAALLPLADIVNAVVTVLPAYNLDLFLDGVQQVLSGDILGGIVNAILMPWAADVGLLTYAGLIGLISVGQGIYGAIEPLLKHQQTS